MALSCHLKNMNQKIKKKNSNLNFLLVPRNATKHREHFIKK